jgi:hypothetical protein
MKKTISWLLLSTFLFSTSSFAGLEQIPVTTVSTDAAVEKIAMPYYGNGNITYKYDEKKLKELYDKNSSLIEVSCQSDDVFKNLWVNAGSIKINNIGFSKNDLDITVDAKNCSFYAGRSVWNQSAQGTTDEKALAAAQKFVDEVFGEKGIVSVPTLGKAIITMRDNGGMYPVYDTMRNSEMKSTSGISSIPLVTNTGKDEKINVQYNSITIIYPYVIGWTPVYNNYGWGKMWISITVDGNGISYANVPLLAFKWIAKTAEKNTFEGLKKFISQWGNNQYYGSNWTEATVKLDTPERVLVYFNYYVPNGTTPRNFISDGIRLWSTLKQDMYSQQNYEMILSDFIIGNNNNIVLMDPSVSTTATEKTDLTMVRKNIPTKKIGLKKKIAVPTDM